MKAVFHIVLLKVKLQSQFECMEIRQQQLCKLLQVHIPVITKSNCFTDFHQIIFTPGEACMPQPYCS